mgnify:CR=1 FL=1
MILKNEVLSIIDQFNYPNLKYYYTECEGFVNSYMSLKYGEGKFLKLLNSQTCLKKRGSLAALLELVEQDLESILLSYRLMVSSKDLTLLFINLLMNLCMLLLIILHGVMLLVFGEMIMKKNRMICFRMICFHILPCLWLFLISLVLL